jgi:hypothetical protein
MRIATSPFKAAPLKLASSGRVSIDGVSVPAAISFGSGVSRV